LATELQIKREEPRGTSADYFPQKLRIIARRHGSLRILLAAWKKGSVVASSGVGFAALPPLTQLAFSKFFVINFNFLRILRLINHLLSTPLLLVFFLR
jgi:hypothetical protein